MVGIKLISHGSLHNPLWLLHNLDILVHVNSVCFPPRGKLFEINAFTVNRPNRTLASLNTQSETQGILHIWKRVRLRRNPI